MGRHALFPISIGKIKKKLKVYNLQNERNFKFKRIAEKNVKHYGVKS